MRRLGPVLACAVLFTACSDDDATSDPISGSTEALTYFHDIVPIFEGHCLTCHREGGGAPFRLDDYAQAKAMAPAIKASTQSRHMPPWGVTSDGTCGTFEGSLALSDADIAKIGAWVDGGAREGEQRAVDLPQVASLTDARTLTTPTFVPVIQGGALAASDEYRCFEVDTGISEAGFITGYEVVPGTPAIVHHLLLNVVDPDAPTELSDRPGLTNGALIAELDAESPDRLGWPCFNGAGDGVSVGAVPIVWAPGQGVVRYPGRSGVPLSPKAKLIVQVHYNLADPALRGSADSTAIKLELASKVERIGFFSLEDPLLASLYEDEPHALEAGKRSVPYTWQRSADEMGLPPLPDVQLAGVMPHMHQLGKTYRMRVLDGERATCAADVRHWDFHWQRMYFYEQPIPVTADTRFEVTCDFDTSSRKEPVLPGWGTQNEMCLATLYFTAPASAFEPH